MSSPPVTFQRTYVSLASPDLSKVYVRDTVVVDDTGAGIADLPLQLPKIGTAYAPVGKRITIVKPSNATHAVAIIPATLDAVSSGTPAAFPDFGGVGAANNTALPAGTPASVMLEATDMNRTGSTQPNPVGGTPTTLGAWLAIASGTGGGGITPAVPASPVYYVASTGSDAASQPGTLAAPLRTVQEATRRLGRSGWLVEAFIRILDTVDLGANPVVDYPAPIGNALPICLQTTYTVDIADAVVTAGYIGNSSTSGGLPIDGATFTTTANRTLNQDRGKLVLVKTGPNAGTRYPLESNTAGPNTVYTITTKLVTVPDGTNTLDIISRSGKLTYSGELVQNFPGGLLQDGIEFLPTGTNALFTPVGSTLQDSGTKYTTAAAGFRFNMTGCVWEACVLTPFTQLFAANSRQKWNPTGITPCGIVMDGTAAVGAWGVAAGIPENRQVFQAAYIKSWNVSTNLGTGGYITCIFEDCTFTGVAGLSVFASRVQNGRLTSGAVMGFSGTTAGGKAILSGVSFITPPAGFLINLTFGARVLGSGITGVASGGTNQWLNVTNGSEYYDGGSNTVTGAVPGQDVVVDGGVAFSSAVSAAIVQIASQNGSFQHSSDSSGAPGAASINKLSGRSALAAGTGAAGITITNSLVQAGDNIQITPMGAPTTGVPDSASGPISVLPGNGSFVVRTQANANAILVFAWRVVKATV